MNYKLKIRDSTIWESIIKKRDVIRRTTSRKVKNGNNISFWKDSWMEDRPTIEILN